MNFKKIALILFVALLAVSLIACGDDDKTSTSGDATALKAAITTAQALHDGATDDGQPGNYTTGSKATYQTAITAAQAVANNTAAAQGQIDVALTDLNTATETFKKAIVSGLYFSEYFEGINSDRYIEIYNFTSSTIDLSAYKIRKVYYKEGAANPAKNYEMTLSGTLAAGNAYVIFLTDVTNTNSTYGPGADGIHLTNVANLSSNFLTDVGPYPSYLVNHTGDECFELIINSSTVDVLGLFDGTEWGLNKKFVRKSGMQNSPVFKVSDWTVTDLRDLVPDPGNPAITNEVYKPALTANNGLLLDGTAGSHTP